MVDDETPSDLAGTAARSSQVEKKKEDWLEDDRELLADAVVGDGGDSSFHAGYGSCRSCGSSRGRSRAASRLMELGVVMLGYAKVRGRGLVPH